MFLSMILDGLKPIIGILAMLTVFILSIIYQVSRQRFNFQSFGEQLVAVL